MNNQYQSETLRLKGIIHKFSGAQCMRQIKDQLWQWTRESGDLRHALQRWSKFAMNSLNRPSLY